jgi:enoyl-CoA hydratase/carnithine racemase
MSTNDVLFAREGSVATVTLNRPERGNALTNEMFSLIQTFIDEVEDDASVRAVVLTGAGATFCGGVDITGRSPDAGRHSFQEHADLAVSTFWRIWDSRLPFVVAARGRCMAGGLYLACVCDLVLATPETQIGMPELKIGMSPPLFNLFPWLLELRTAKEFLLTGGIVDAARAVQLNLINRVVADEQLQPEAMALATSLAEMPDQVVQVMKRSINRRWELAGFRTGIEEDVRRFVTDKVHMGPFQTEYRRLTQEFGPRVARERLGMR